MAFDDAVCLADDDGVAPRPRPLGHGPRGSWPSAADPPEDEAPPAMHPLRAALLFPLAGESRGATLWN